jgi:Gas vesicle protein
MTNPNPWLTGQRQASGANLADVLERVLDKGLVIAGDIKICLLDIELLTIKLRLLVASVERAKAMGIDWWEYDPSLSSRHQRQLAAENERLRGQIGGQAAEAVGGPAAGQISGQAGGRAAGQISGQAGGQAAGQIGGEVGRRAGAAEAAGEVYP